MAEDYCRVAANTRRSPVRTPAKKMKKDPHQSNSRTHEPRHKEHFQLLPLSAVLAQEKNSQSQIKIILGIATEHFRYPWWQSYLRCNSHALKNRRDHNLGFNQGADMCIDMCIDISGWDQGVDMCFSMRMDVCIDILGRNQGAEMCANMCIDMCIGITRRGQRSSKVSRCSAVTTKMFG